MKIGDIAFKIYTLGLIGLVSLGIGYTAIATSVTGVQNYQHRFSSNVEVNGIKVDYKGRKPYNPFIRFPGQDKNGWAKVALKGNEHVFLRYDNLTALPLEGRIKVMDPEGNEQELNKKGKYDKKTRIEIDKLEGALEYVGLDGRSLRRIVEEEIREAIAKR